MEKNFAKLESDTKAVCTALTLEKRKTCTCYKICDGGNYCNFQCGECLHYDKFNTRECKSIRAFIQVRAKSIIDGK